MKILLHHLMNNWMIQLVTYLFATSKTVCAFMVAAVLTPVVHIIEKYIFHDWEFLGFLLVLVLLDTGLGFAAHYKNKSISSAGFAKFFKKLIVYFSLLILVHIMTHCRIGGQPIHLFDWFDDVIYTTLIIREAISIMENTAMINPRFVPRWLIERLQLFDKLGETEIKKDKS